MMHSEISAATLLDRVIAGMGMFTPPSRDFFRDTMNECLTRLYTELVRESAWRTISIGGAYVPFERILSPTGVPVEREDILAVYADGKQARYLRSDLHDLTPDTKKNFFAPDDTGILLAFPAAVVRVCFLLRPPICTAQNETTYMLPLPREFVPLLRARLLGEGYKMAGEDALAAKWLEEYNQALEGFAAYLATRRIREA